MQFEEPVLHSRTPATGSALRGTKEGTRGTQKKK
jgi:hypothetical protein